MLDNELIKEVLYFKKERLDDVRRFLEAIPDERKDLMEKFELDSIELNNKEMSFRSEHSELMRILPEKFTKEKIDVKVG